MSIRKRADYRKLAFKQYRAICAYCGFGIAEVLEVCHLDGKRENNDLGALWQNLWVKMAHPKGRQASPLRGGDRRRRELGLGSRRRRSPACPWDVGVS